MESKAGLDSELESFRKEWLSEVRTKRGERPSTHQQQPSNEPSESSTSASVTAVPASAKKSNVRPPSPTKTRKTGPVVNEDDEFLHGRPFDGLPEPSGNTIDGSVRSPPAKKLISALDHYEEAMEREAEGKLGDSLRLYRMAYKLDNTVDRSYREKHFPQGPAAKSSTAEKPPPSKASGTAGLHSIQSTSKPTVLPIKDLIGSFSHLQIEPASSEVEGAPPPPCPMSSLPGELLIHIMQDVAAQDVGEFARLSLVCKPFAYLVATEQRIWRDVSLGLKFGFTGMHYHWNKTLDWKDTQYEELELEDGTLVSMKELAEWRVVENVLMTKSLIPDPYATWKHMFRSRPRIRFNGCYISTVNYIRPGQASIDETTWSGNPMHIVTYYRYLRFFRDGTAISLLTTSEPSNVVHHITRDLLQLHRDNTHSYLPSAVMEKAYKGRWRLTSEIEATKFVAAENERPPQEGDLTVETETHDPKYMFRMDLSLRTAGKTAHNNKVVWRGHFSYNKLTDDWAEFMLRHDKSFFFSRVKSYRLGE
ncbi:hypothetical protein QQS21_006041 [Conoideocrella luteorostrata]|uniref:F-box domain-containing protein n=1 Tax=Conoideocrella luteorostrata TaxID=1105319 RepID=A0AAJ0FYL0_9HYPO|nr:hypothetical protein QQS21_006041 [Conoideocrella luteorostrata]